jgi:hypothetical protein
MSSALTVSEASTFDVFLSLEKKEDTLFVDATAVIPRLWLSDPL